MTQREFYELVIKAELNEQMSEFAKAEIAKMDAKNEKRRNTLTKEQKANEELKVAVKELLMVGTPTVASQVAQTLNVSTQKASSLLQMLVKDGIAKVGDLKVKGKGSVKGYSLVG